ncbi:MAG TPA: nucleoside triphosphate pyrophosphohydrolase [Candidatus Paceibacterota bacterium]|nr:nucleoside triphosphate pyrophosphohydrolase [Candidatus Paceibacterota bacterium]
MGEYKSWKKLVRDFIPKQLEAKGIKVIYSTVGDFFGRDQFSREKLAEEATEVMKAKTRAEILEEMADVAEVFDVVLKVNKITPQELADARAKKNAKKGSFETFQYLESTEEPENPDGQQ